MRSICKNVLFFVNAKCKCGDFFRAFFGKIDPPSLQVSDFINSVTKIVTPQKLSLDTKRKIDDFGENGDNLLSIKRIVAI